MNVNQPKPKRHPLLLGGGIGVLALVGIGVAGHNSGEERTSAGAPIVPVTAPAYHPPTASAAALTPAGSRTTFGTGTYKVGAEIDPGEYRTPGSTSGGCYWARLKDTTHNRGSVHEAGNAEGPTIVTVEPTDAAFQVTGCTWTKVG